MISPSDISLVEDEEADFGMEQIEKELNGRRGAAESDCR